MEGEDETPCHSCSALWCSDGAVPKKDEIRGIHAQHLATWGSSTLYLVHLKSAFEQRRGRSRSRKKYNSAGRTGQDRERAFPTPARRVEQVTLQLGGVWRILCSLFNCCLMGLRAVISSCVCFGCFALGIMPQLVHQSQLAGPTGCWGLTVGFLLAEPPIPRAIPGFLNEAMQNNHPRMRAGSLPLEPFESSQLVCQLHRIFFP